MAGCAREQAKLSWVTGAADDRQRIQFKHEYNLACLPACLFGLAFQLPGERVECCAEQLIHQLLANIESCYTEC